MGQGVDTVTCVADRITGVCHIHRIICVGVQMGDELRCLLDYVSGKTHFLPYPLEGEHGADQTVYGGPLAACLRG